MIVKERIGINYTEELRPKVTEASGLSKRLYQLYLIYVHKTNEL